jgi:hypothetical protein
LTPLSVKGSLAMLLIRSTRRSLANVAVGGCFTCQWGATLQEQRVFPTLKCSPAILHESFEELISTNFSYGFVLDGPSKRTVSARSCRCTFPYLSFFRIALEASVGLSHTFMRVQRGEQRKKPTTHPVVFWRLMDSTSSGIPSYSSSSYRSVHSRSIQSLTAKHHGRADGWDQLGGPPFLREPAVQRRPGNKARTG